MGYHDSFGRARANEARMERERDERIRESWMTYRRIHRLLKDV